MANTSTQKQKSNDKKMDDQRTNDVDYKQEKRREDTEAGEAAQQKDLNQGMQTGTHDTVRHGVNWGSSYETPQNQERKQTSANNDKTDKSSKKQKVNQSEEEF